jgi:hypothetical protein
VSLQVGFYNIEWTDTQLSGQNHEMHREQLGRDCARAFEFNDLGMLCLCQVGTNRLDENLHAHLGNSAGFQDKYRGQNVNRWLEQVIQECCKTSIDLQAYVLGPYAIVLNKSVCCFEGSPKLTGALVTYPGTDHTYRRAVHSVIQVLPHGPLIEVWVHHAPSSKGRGYTPLAREQTTEYFFDNVSDKAIVGGDLNMSKHGIKNALRTWSSRSGYTQEEIDQRWKTWQIHMLPEAKHGDLALSHGFTASQIAVTRVGCNTDDATSNAHELVVVQISLGDLPPHKRSSLEPSSDAHESSAAQPAPAARRLSEDSRARKFLAALDEAAHERDDNPAQATLLRELVNSLWWGKLMRMPTDDVWHLDAEKQEDFAIAKLDQLIELVVTIRMAWIDSPESEQARKVAGRHLEQLQGDMSDREIASCHNYYMNSLVWMSEEKRAEYDRLKHEQEESNREKNQAKGKSKGKLDTKGKDKEKGGPGPGQRAQQLKKKSFNVFCFQASGCRQLLFALVRQPSFLKAKGLENLLEEWASIKKTSEYNEAVEQSKQRTEEQTKQKAELQNLRIQINRLRRKDEDTEDLLLELENKEKSYGRGKQKRPPGSYLATNQIFSTE